MQSKQPNILLITADQQRFDAAGDAAPGFLRTPHFDRLCREGVTFTNAYTDCPLCVPTRISIMSGKQAFNHGMPWNGESSEVLGWEDTLPTLLGNAGYQTVGIGKMHFGPQRVRHGFGEMILPEDYYREMREKGEGVSHMVHGLGQNEFYPTMSALPETKTLTAWTSNKCAEYIRERRDPSRPFFLWCSYTKPHPPFDPPEPYYSMYNDAPLPEPFYGDWSDPKDYPAALKRYQVSQSYDLLPKEIIMKARAAYYGLITQIDYSMGYVLASLQDEGLLDDTLIIYTSDHGEYLGDHHACAKGHFHESSAHVPFVMRLPKSWEDHPHGKTNTALITHADILPTLLRAAGAAVPADKDGVDLIGLTRGEVKPREYLEAMMGNVTEWITPPTDCDYLAITDGGWKYIWYPEGGVEQIFNLKDDPHELTNLADQVGVAGAVASGPAAEEATAAKKRLKAELISRHRKRNSPYLENGKLPYLPEVEVSPEDLRNQNWPGYITEHAPVDVRH